MSLPKIDRFYVVLIVILVLLSAMVIFTFRGVFSAFNVANEIDQAGLEAGLKINNENLDKVNDWVFAKKATPLIK